MAEMNEANTFLDSARGVKKALIRDHQIKAKESEVRAIMREDLGMRFRKIVAVSIHANSAKNLVLRQQYALELIRLVDAGWNILNIDETWLGQADFRRRKWRVPGSTNSVPQLQMTPRISMIAGLDCKGQIYLSLVQSNNNNQVMELFFRALAKKLDDERPRWRSDTVVLLDNAPYHRC